MSNRPTNKPYTVRGGHGTRATIRRDGAYPAPYVADITWPNGKTETISPTDIEDRTGINTNAQRMASYVHTFVAETAQSGDF